MTSRTAHVIVNPVAGTSHHEPAIDRARRAAARLEAAGWTVEVTITERPLHAYESARAAVDRGTSLVVAWGGDGTVNEAARALLHREAALAIIPRGSGNGFARDLRIPLQAGDALDVSASGVVRAVDAGTMAGLPFVNLAGVGFDAHIASAFARNRGRRGFARYLAIAATEVRGYAASTYRITPSPGHDERALMVVVANGSQYGNGARIAPAARMDDGWLDLVVVEARGLGWTLARLPSLFTGRVAPRDGIRITRVAEARIDADRPMQMHVDGEPHVRTGPLDVRVLPGALRVLTPP